MPLNTAFVKQKQIRLHMYIHAYIHTYCLGLLTTLLSQAGASSSSCSLASFKFAEGAEVWGDIIGQDAEAAPAGLASLAVSKVRPHIGLYKALLTSAQQLGTQRFGCFLGTLWKGSWRGRTLLMSSNLECLISAAASKGSESYNVLGAAVVAVSPDNADVNTPNAQLLECLQQRLSSQVSDPFIILHAQVSESSTKTHLQVFEVRKGSTDAERVKLSFLSKRLAKEEVYVTDLDAKKSSTVPDLVNEVISVPWPFAL